MSTDFGFVVQTAERHADIFSVQRLCDALAERGLAHAGRAIKAEDWGFEVVFQLQHRQIFQYAFLDFFEPVMVVVEGLAGGGNCKIVVCASVPRQVEERLDIIEFRSKIGRLRIEGFESFEFLLKSRLRVLGPILGLGAFLHVDDCRRRVVAEFFLEGFNLLIDNIIALFLVEFLLDTLGDVHLEVYLLLLLAEKREKTGCAFLDGING